MGTINYINIPTVSLRFNDEASKLRSKISSHLEVTEFVRPYFQDFIQHHEEFWCLLLNRSNKVIGISRVSQGSICETVVDVKIIMQTAILSNASGIVVIHNHPSGELNPSLQDKQATDTIKYACNMFNITLVDHIILTDESSFSFVTEGLL